MDAGARDGNAAPEAEESKQAVKAVEEAEDAMQDIDIDPLATVPSAEEVEGDAVPPEPGSSAPLTAALDTEESFGQEPHEAAPLTLSLIHI